MRKTMGLARPVSIHRVGALLLLALALVSCGKSNPVAPSAANGSGVFSRLEVTPAVFELSESGPANAMVMASPGATDVVMLDGGLSAQVRVRDARGRMRRWGGLRSVPLGLVALPRLARGGGDRAIRPALRHSTRTTLCAVAPPFASSR